MSAIAVTRVDLDAAGLRRAAACSKDAAAARRMLALALVLDGSSREAAAQSCGMDRQTLRDWVHRYNAQGLAGLVNRKAPGRRRYLDDEQRAELARLVEAGPTPDKDGVVRWRRVDLKGKIEDIFGVRMHE